MDVRRTPQGDVPLPKLEWVVDNPKTNQFTDATDVCTAMEPARAPNRTLTRASVRILPAIVVFALMAMCEPGRADAQAPPAVPIGTATASATQPTCTSPGPGKPIFITADCVDPRFNDPYIIEDTPVNATVWGVPVPYTYIHGGFGGTDATFSFYFPPASMYQGRFFQMNVHQLRTTGDSASIPIPPQVLDQIDKNTPSDQSAGLVFFQENEIGYAFNTGGYLVETSPNNEAPLTARDALSGKWDPSVQYRVAAAAAKFSRAMAAQIYGTNTRPFGYISGGRRFNHNDRLRGEHQRRVGRVCAVRHGRAGCHPHQFVRDALWLARAVGAPVDVALPRRCVRTRRQRRPGYFL